MSSDFEAITLENLWRKLAEHPGQENQELDLSLHLPLVIGCTLESQPYIMLLSNEQPKPMTSLEAIDVRIGSRISPIGEDWSLTFVLQDWGLLHAFAEICLAFVERIQATSSGETGLREICATVDQWQRLLKTVRQSNQLTILRGVCGELIAALEVMKLTSKSIESICEAWSGPYEMPQDYSFASERDYWEIKTIHSSAKRFLVSSPEQLDTSDRQINLITVVLDTPAGRNSEQLTSLPQIIDKLRCFSSDPTSVSLCIDNGLSALGIAPYSDMAKHTTFAVGQVTVYSVSKDFPRITPPSVPNGVTGLTYAVERATIRPFITNVDDTVLSISEE